MKAIRQASPGHWVRSDGTAEATRYKKADTGGSWHGWVVRSLVARHSYSDPIPTREEALKALRTWGADV